MNNMESMELTWNIGRHAYISAYDEDVLIGYGDKELRFNPLRDSIDTVFKEIPEDIREEVVGFTDWWNTILLHNRLKSQVSDGKTKGENNHDERRDIEEYGKTEKGYGGHRPAISERPY